jgi:hypothetical protein
MQGSIAALSMTAPGLNSHPGTFMMDKQVMALLDNIREDCIDLNGVRSMEEVNVTGLEALWPQKFLVQPVHEVITFNAGH